MTDKQISKDPLYCVYSILMYQYAFDGDWSNAMALIHGQNVNKELTGFRAIQGKEVGFEVIFFDQENTLSGVAGIAIELIEKEQIKRIFETIEVQKPLVPMEVLSNWITGSPDNGHLVFKEHGFELGIFNEWSESGTCQLSRDYQKTLACLERGPDWIKTGARYPIVLETFSQYGIYRYWWSDVVSVKKDNYNNLSLSKVKKSIERFE